MGLAPAGSPIVALPDPTGATASRLEAAGLRIAGRGGCARLAFHVWNDESDVEAVLAAVR
jgi:selenocysteine lyase/cysteine desulfurase